MRLKNKEDQRKHLFNTYIDRMFERRPRVANSAFTNKQTLHTLRWLACQMLLHKISTYQIESMQPSWLADKNHRRSYALLFLFIGGLLLGLLSGLLFTLLVGLVDGLLLGLLVGLVAVLFLALPLGSYDFLYDDLSAAGAIQMVDRLRWSWKQVQSNQYLGCNSPFFGMVIFGLLGGLLGVQRSEFSNVLVVWQNGGPSVEVKNELRVGDVLSVLGSVLGGALCGGLLFGLLLGLSNKQVEETTHPGQGLKQTLFNGLLVVVSIGLVFGLSGALFFGLIDGLSGGLTVGLIIGLIVSLGYGIHGLIQHFTLRFLLIKDGWLPWRLIPFLDHAVDLIFLRRVGGSYIFIHRLIMEHFAEMDV